MRIYPAIDLFDGHVVRLQKGDFNLKTVYSDNPVTFAEKWVNDGAEWLHVVDLEGAKTGVLKNLASILKIRRAVKCKIQLGGGMRSFEVIHSVLSEGIDRVVCGTKALNYEFLSEALMRFAGKIAVGLDAKNGILQTEGWLDSGNPTLDEALEQFKKLPLETLIYTDIQKDGMMSGPDFDGLSSILSKTKSRVILSGGVSTLQDIQKCQALVFPNFEGAIIGKSLYEGKIQLKEAIQLISGSL